MTSPRPPDPVAAPAPQGGVMKSVIPTGNKPALVGYYCAVFALVPGFGAPLAPLAVVLGVMGLSKVRANPAARGTAHAWVAILLGLAAGVSQFSSLPWIMDRYFR